jgi:ABC-type bacteriocin/lantibiotic exporter with double-glycine peptidase domain
MNVTDDIVKEAKGRTLNTITIAAFVIAILTAIFFYNSTLLVWIFFGTLALGFILFVIAATYHWHIMNIMEERFDKQIKELRDKKENFDAKV